MTKTNPPIIEKSKLSIDFVGYNCPTSWPLMIWEMKAPNAQSSGISFTWLAYPILFKAPSNHICLADFSKMLKHKNLIYLADEKRVG